MKEDEKELTFLERIEKEQEETIELVVEHDVLVDFEEEEARELLADDPEIGQFIWLRRNGESTKTFLYFQIWLELRYLPVPRPRLIKNVQEIWKERTGIDIGDQTLIKHMKTHQWVKRTIAFDKFQIASKAEALKYRAPIEAEKLITTSNRLLEIANKVIDSKFQIAEEDPQSISINEITKIMRIVIDANKSAQEVMQMVRKEVKDTERDKDIFLQLVEKYDLKK